MEMFPINFQKKLFKKADEKISELVGYNYNLNHPLNMNFVFGEEIINRLDFDLEIQTRILDQNDLNYLNLFIRKIAFKIRNQTFYPKLRG